jgi:SAM-dependent methyltransferase
MQLKPEQRDKLDSSNDRLFYDAPRFVTHVDEGFIQQLTALYREKLPAGGRILDLMSSWVSHLPDDVEFSHVEGHGLNAEELARNKRLDHYFVQNLNTDLQLPLADQSFDAVICTVSVQYLQYPEAIFSEVYRVLKNDGIAIFSFSNRMFYQKAIAAWRDSGDQEHVNLVRSYFMGLPRFSTPEIVENVAPAAKFLQMLGMGGADPFYAVIAKRMM